MALILLLDDEELLRSLLAEILYEDGHTVLQGSDGLLAFNESVLNRIDLLITDLYMPRIDGMGVILHVRKERPDLKMIAMSGGGEYVTRDFLPSTADFGASAILRKPFLPDEFLRTVAEVMAAPAREAISAHQPALAS